MQRNKHSAQRSIALGSLGELLAIRALVFNKFHNIRFLNDYCFNHAFADIYAEEDSRKYVISVKARNRYQRNGKLNARYNLGSGCAANAQRVASKYGAVPAWMAISITDQTYSVYFGRLDSLRLSTGIPMAASHVSQYRCLANEQLHHLDWAPYRNK